LGVEVKMTRRSLARGIAAAGTAMGLARLAGAEASKTPAAAHAAAWERVYAGVWRARLGTPERFTPVSSRLVAPDLSGFEKLPRADTAP
jgi:alpha-D-xyloside xylohydrolase